MVRQEMRRDEGTMRVFREFSREAMPGQSFSISDGVVNLGALAEQARARGDKGMLEVIWNRLEIERERRNNPDLNLSELNVLGRSSYSFRENVAQSASELFRQGRGIDLVEEKAETDAFRFMSRSPQTREALRRAILQVERATGDKYLFNDSDLGLVEAYSAMVRLYVTGSRPGARGRVSEAVRSEEAALFRDQRARLRSAYEQGDVSLMETLRENMEFFRQTMHQAARLRLAEREGRLGEAGLYMQETLGLTRPVDGDAFTAPATPYMEWAPSAAGGLHQAMGMSVEPVVRNLDDAESYLRSLSGSPLTTADGITATLSNLTAAKMVSGSAVKKSQSYRAHLFAIQNFEPLFAAGEIRQTHRDRANDPNIAAIHRVFSDFAFEGKGLTAKFTVKELLNPAGNRIYSIEAVELEGAPPAGLLINGGSEEPRTIPLTRGAGQGMASEGMLQGQSGVGGDAGRVLTEGAAQTLPGLRIVDEGPHSGTPTSEQQRTLVDFMQGLKADAESADRGAPRGGSAPSSLMQGFSLDPSAMGPAPLWNGVSGYTKDGQAKVTAILARTEQGNYRMRIPGGREQEMSEATVASMTGFSPEQLRGLPDSAASLTETPSATRQAAQAAQAKAAQPVVDVQREAFKKRLGSPNKQFTQEQRQMEDAFVEMISRDVRASVSSYVKRFGNRVDADNARRLFPAYDSSRESRQALTPVTGRTSNALAQEVYESLLENPSLLRDTGGTPNGPVLFLAGGAGSGKSSSVAKDKISSYSIIVDSVLGNKSRAIKQIDMAVEKGRKVRIQYVHQPLEKAVENAIARALDSDDGRIVPAHVVAATHMNAQQALFELLAHYDKHPDVDFQIVDHDKFAARPITVQEMMTKRYSLSAEELAKLARDHARKILQQKVGKEGLTPEMVEQILVTP